MHQQSSSQLNNAQLQLLVPLLLNSFTNRKQDDPTTTIQMVPLLVHQLVRLLLKSQRVLQAESLVVVVEDKMKICSVV